MSESEIIRALADMVLAKVADMPLNERSDITACVDRAMQEVRTEIEDRRASIIQ